MWFAQPEHRCHVASISGVSAAAVSEERHKRDRRDLKSSKRERERQREEMWRGGRMEFSNKRVNEKRQPRLHITQTPWHVLSPSSLADFVVPRLAPSEARLCPLHFQRFFLAFYMSVNCEDSKRENGNARTATQRRHRKN